MPEPPEYSLIVSEDWHYNEPSFSGILTELWPYSEPPSWWGYYQPPTEEPPFTAQSIVKVEIGLSAGQHEDLTAIEYGGDRAVGSGAGGDLLSIRTVLNTVGPVGVLHHNKWWEIILVIREDEIKALFDNFVNDSLNAIEMENQNTPIDYLKITYRSRSGLNREVFYEDAYATRVESKLTNEKGEYFSQIKFMARTRFSGGCYVYETWGAREPPAMSKLVDETWFYYEPPTYIQYVNELWSN